jgi:hypothetical protein
MKRVPRDALLRYVMMGPERSYRALAKKLGMSVFAINERAQKEKWQETVKEIEREARERLTPVPPVTQAEEDRQLRERCVETMVSMNARHIDYCHTVQDRCLDVLKKLPMDLTSADAIRGLEAAVKLERVIRGEPGERVELAALIKKEAEMFLRPVEVVEAGGEVDGEMRPRLLEGP